jgi:uncharacterized protein involved in exopolysaccharide biosynthesis
MAASSAWACSWASLAGSSFVLFAVNIKLLPKTYNSTATLMVNYEVSNPLGGNQAPEKGIYNYMSTEVQLMESSEVLLPLIERLKLTEDKYYTAGYHGVQGDQNSLEEYVKEVLIKDLDIESGRAGSQLIYVTASARNPLLAAGIANTLVDLYLDQEATRRSGPASDRAKRYSQELAELKNKVNVAQDQLTAFRQKAGVTDAAAQNKNVEADLLATLETRLQEAQNARRAAEVKAAEDQRVTSGAAASLTIQGVKTQLNTERAQLAELRATMGPRHPKVIELQNQIDANQRILDSEFNNYSAGASSDLAAARQLESKLQAAVAEQRTKALSISRMQDEGTKYVLELESAQSVYKRALDTYDQIMFAPGTHNMNLITRAVPQLNATKPDKVKLMLIGVVVGLLAGLLGPVGYELLINRRIRCRDDFERGFSVPVLMEFDAIPAARFAL